MLPFEPIFYLFSRILGPDHYGQKVDGKNSETLGSLPVKGSPCQESEVMCELEGRTELS